MANGDTEHNQNADVESAMEGSQAMEIEESTNHVESEGSNKHEHGEEDQDSVRSPKRIKIETDDNQETAQTSNDDVPVESEHTNDTEQTEETIAHVVDDEDEVPIKKEKPAVLEERQGLIEFRVFTNDGTRESMILLTGMKNLFQKQLPKMPREYIARLVYDRYVCFHGPPTSLCS